MNNKNDLLFYTGIGLISVMTAALMIWITPYGSGVSPDSTIYIGTAKSLLSGNGFAISGDPITHYPPLYPLLLVTTSLFEKNLVQAARFINAVLFGINLGLVTLAVYLTTERNYLAATCAAFFFLSSAPFLVLHSYAWSEPLFITFMLACLILLSMYVVKPTIFLFVASSLSMGFALITRYVGVAFLPAAFIILIFGGAGRHIGRRISNTLIWSMLACAPLVVFLARNIIMAGTATDRSLIYHPILGSDYVKDVIVVVLNFFAPISLPPRVKPTIFGLLIIFLFASLVILFKRHLASMDWHSFGKVISLSCILFFSSYLLFLFISISFIDASTPVDTRLLSPILAILIVALFIVPWTISQKLKWTIAWWCFLFLMVLSISIKTPEAIRAAVGIKQNGLGYTSRLWQESEGIAFVKSIADDVKIYSNGPDAIRVLAEKQSILLPMEINSNTMMDNPRYSEEFKAMCKDILENKALLVYFNQITWRWYLPTQEELESYCPMPVLQHFEDGITYGGK